MANGVRQTSSGVVESSSGVAQTVVSGVSVVDSFEDQNISEYGGDTGQFTTDNTRAQDGSWSLFLDEHQSSNPGISSTSGLDNYPSQGDTFKGWVYQVSASGTGGWSNLRYWVRWATQSETWDADGYVLDINGQDDNLDIIVRNNGSNSTVSSNSSFSDSWSNYEDSWIEWEVTWGTDNSIDCTVYDSGGTTIASVSGSDNTFTSQGGVGYILVCSGDSSNNDGNNWSDYYRITS